jgi:GT2 family glycosyltransferase
MKKDAGWILEMGGAVVSRHNGGVAAGHAAMETVTRLLSVSIVIYGPVTPMLANTLVSLDRALCQLPDAEGIVYLVNNNSTPLALDALRALGFDGFSCGAASCVVEGHGNIGYGRAHNIAIERTPARYHLILNPDIDLAPDALRQALAFLQQRPEIGLLTPRIVDADGAMQFLCRRPPALVDLLIRGFLPRCMRKPFDGRLARYEMRDVIGAHDVVYDPPIMSGCFMMFNTEILREIGGFDPRYFLYFEDYDLSLRASKMTHSAYVPSVKVTHFGGDASRKGWHHISMFVVSAFKFYRRFGWRLI